jgi:hypothetical protein
MPRDTAYQRRRQVGDWPSDRANIVRDWRVAVRRQLKADRPFHWGVLQCQLADYLTLVPPLTFHSQRLLKSTTDFFIHLGTIAIGLFIAIGLEQSVEALHHRRQVQEMALKLHQESTDNLEVIAYDLKRCDIPLSA